MAGVLLGAVAQAGSFAERPFETTVESAGAIVRGHVGAVARTDWGESPTGSRAIYTFHEFNVSEWLKGEGSGNQVIVRQLGGEKDGQAMQVPGVASLQNGEELVLFLRPGQTDATFEIQGMSLGRYELVKGPDGEEILQGAGATSAQPRTLQSLRDLIATQKAAQLAGNSKGAAQALRNSPAEPVRVVHDPREADEHSGASEDGEAASAAESNVTRRRIVIVLGVLAALGFYLLRRQKRR